MNLQEFRCKISAVQLIRGSELDGASDRGRQSYSLTSRVRTTKGGIYGEGFSFREMKETPSTDPERPSVPVVQLQDVSLHRDGGQRRLLPRQGGAVVLSAAFLQLKHRSSRD